MQGQFSPSPCKICQIKFRLAIRFLPEQDQRGILVVFTPEFLLVLANLWCKDNVNVIELGFKRMLSKDFYSQTINQDNIYPSFWLVKEKYLLGAKKVLDLGCADGRYLGHFGAGSMGAELSKEGLKSALEKKLNVKECDLNRIKPADFDSYEVVFSSHVIEHLDSPLPFLRNCRGLSERAVFFDKEKVISSK